MKQSVGKVNVSKPNVGAQYNTFVNVYLTDQNSRSLNIPLTQAVEILNWVVQITI